MENQGHPRAEKTQRQLRVYFQNNKDLESIKDLINRFPVPLKICTSAHQSSLIIDSDDENWIFIDNKNLLERTVLQLEKTSSNLSSFIYLYHQNGSHTDSLDENISKTERRVLEKRKQKKSSYKKLIQSLKKEEFFEDIQAVEEKSDFSYLLNNLASIELLTQNILNLGAFRGYHSCQILIHGRGNPNVDNYYSNNSGRSLKSNLSVSSFNAIFNLIRKSKNKLFDQTQILKSDLGVVGTFLAKEIDLKTYRVVFIISRDDFLPTSKREQNYFDEISNNLSPIIEFLLLKQDVDKRESHLLQALVNYPLPLAVLDKDQEFIIKSDNFEQKHIEELEDGGPFFDSFNLSNGYKLAIYRQDTDSITTDIHHFQRISLLGELLNTLQHELSNPLFGLKLTAELLKTESEDDEVLETLDEILQNSSRCQTIIENFSYLYQDKKDYQLVDLEKLLNETSTLSKSETRGIQKEIFYHNFDSTEGIFIEINPTWITQIIFNLVVNSAQAIKTLGDDYRDHKIAINVEKRANDLICISVSDTGPGISQQSLEKVFSPFYTTKSQGTGLGLSICRNLARKLGGDLTFQNNTPLPGATFSLNLPL